MNSPIRKSRKGISKHKKKSKKINCRSPPRGLPSNVNIEKKCKSQIKKRKSGRKSKILSKHDKLPIWLKQQKKNGVSSSFAKKNKNMKGRGLDDDIVSLISTTGGTVSNPTFTCTLCNITFTNEILFNRHPQTIRHKIALEILLSDIKGAKLGSKAEDGAGAEEKKEETITYSPSGEYVEYIEQLEHTIKQLQQDKINCRTDLSVRLL